ncbi:MAG: hypothetical protein GF317_01380 [Candidatus Lokiarchaeota archaeon]|nr:hypothetical protein [Candidatus Lokiarchaeota archaeon]MBD3198596.1 hypothetical protein [Candidatus Lokiarchaeota archaeon]
MIAYLFNNYPYKKIKKIESNLNSLLFLVRIDYALIQNISYCREDSSINFVKMMINYESSLSDDFRLILSRIHCGYTPELELKNYFSVSRDFNEYLKSLLIKNFRVDIDLEGREWNSLEHSFKIFLRQLTTRISLIFFIGIFYPLGISFLVIFLPLNNFFLSFFSPFFIVLLNQLFKRYISIDHYLIGLLNNNNYIDKKRINELILLLKAFAMELINNISPEQAFINAYRQEKSKLDILGNALSIEISKLVLGKKTLTEIIHSLDKTIKIERYRMILKSISKMLLMNSYQSSGKIMQILQTINKHQEFEKKLDLAFKGEKFKALIFIFLLPIIIGTIGALIPFLSNLTGMLAFNNLNNLFDFSYYLKTTEIVLIALTLISCNSVSCYYFLKIVNQKSIRIYTILSDIIFLLVFLMTLINISIA